MTSHVGIGHRKREKRYLFDIFPQWGTDQLFFFFLKFLADTCPFLGPLVPLFWISGDVSSGFQSQSGFCLIHYFCGGECNVHSPRFGSGATLADLLVAGAQLVTSPHACAEVGLGSVSNVRSHEQKMNALPLCQRPGFLAQINLTSIIGVVETSASAITAIMTFPDV